jgi:hypothetical protein
MDVASAFRRNEVADGGRSEREGINRRRDER